jgi:hypothetical protein
MPQLRVASAFQQQVYAMVPSSTHPAPPAASFQWRRRQAGQPAGCIRGRLWTLRSLSMRDNIQIERYKLVQSGLGK